MVRNQQFSALFIVVGLVLAGCNTAPPKNPGDENSFGSSESSPTSTSPPAETGKVDADQPPPLPEKSEGLNADQRKQMEVALKRGGDKAAQCPASTGQEDVPRGKGEVTVTFDGQKGRITDVTVGPPWAGTGIESCIKRSFIGEIILPFEGGALEVPYTIEMPKREGVAPPPKKK